MCNSNSFSKMKKEEKKKGTLRDVHYAHMDMIMKQFNL